MRERVQRSPWEPVSVPGPQGTRLGWTPPTSGSPSTFPGASARKGRGRGLHVFTAQFVPGVPAQSSPSRGHLRPGTPWGTPSVQAGTLRPSSSLAPPGHPRPVTGHPSGGAWGGLLSGSQSEPAGLSEGLHRPLSPPGRPAAAPGQGRGSSVPRATVWDMGSRWPRLWVLEASFVVVVFQNVASTMLFKVCFF